MASKWSTVSKKLALNNLKKGDADSMRHDEDEETLDFPISVNLGGNCLIYQNETWMLEHSPEAEWRERANKLQERLDAVETESKELSNKYQKVIEESNMIKFKNQLLVEMLAVATLDEEKHVEMLEKEQAKTNTLKEELQNILEQALEQGIKLNLDLHESAPFEPQTN